MAKSSKLPFGFATPQDSPGFLLWQATTIWQRRIKKALEPHHITHPQFVIMATLLWFLEHGYETTQALIAGWTKLDKMTVSTSLKGLATMALITRGEHQGDTRKKTVAITNKGRALIQKIVPVVEAVDAEFFNTASQPEQKNLIAILQILSRAHHE